MPSLHLPHVYHIRHRTMTLDVILITPEHLPSCVHAVDEGGDAVLHTEVEQQQLGVVQQHGARRVLLST